MWATFLILTYFGGALACFLWGVIKVMHHPLTNHPLSFALAAPPFLVSLNLVLLGLNGWFQFANQDTFVLTETMLLILLAVSHGLAELNRYKARLSLYDVLKQLAQFPPLSAAGTDDPAGQAAVPDPDRHAFGGGLLDNEDSGILLDIFGQKGIRDTSPRETRS